MRATDASRNEDLPKERHTSEDLIAEVTDTDYEKMLEGVSVLVADRKDPQQLKAAVASAGKFDLASLPNKNKG